MNKPSPAPKKASSQKSDYLEIRVPRLSFQNTTANAYLVFSLVIFAFVLGMLTNKVIYLEQVVKTNSASTQPSNAVAPTDIPAPSHVNVENGKLPVLGNPNAKVTIVEFSDFQCPFCEKYFTDTSKQVYDAYIKTGKAKLYYRHFPLTSIHPNALKASEAAECANEQGKFWEYHNILFQNQATWASQTADEAQSSFVDLADQTGLDTTQFSSCLTSDKYKKNVEDDMAAGGDVQVDGTPTFFINGNRMVGAQPFDQFQTLIDQELKK